MRKGQYFSRDFGPRRWGRFSAKVIRGQGAIRQAGAHVHALALGRWRPVGPGVRRRWSQAKAASQGGQDFGDDDDLRLILAENYSWVTTGTTMHTKDAQRAFSAIHGALQLGNHCRADGSSDLAAARPCSRSWPSAMGRAVQGCAALSSRAGCLAGKSSCSGLEFGKHQVFKRAPFNLASYKRTSCLLDLSYQLGRYFSVMRLLISSTSMD
jgi:hypothetical protein